MGNIHGKEYPHYSEEIVQEIKNHINDLDNLDDLSVIVDYIKVKRKRLAASNAAGLIKGDEVRISGSNRIEKGIITKINRTRAIIDVNGVSWTVPFEMIRKVSNE